MPDLAPQLVSALILGLLGGGHCLGMCGGLMGALTLAIPPDQRARRLRLLLAEHQPHQIRRRLYDFYDAAARADMEETSRLATTIDTWWPAVLVALTEDVTNARTEGYNRLVKQVKRVACGFRNTENSRRRIRFHCTRAQRANNQQFHC